MSFHQLALDSGYGSPSNCFLRCMHSAGQNVNGRKKDENDPSYIHCFSFKANEGNQKRKLKVCRKLSWDLEEVEKCTTAANSIIQIKDQRITATREIGVKLIALADAFDAEFFGNLNISKKYM
ncbi:unnamed protein product [Cercopithifilaria johnstoni]|uniref:Uncharacterized protein n=1 Tax=Cercopithifilaria johnstoni TaxID=2874296 RepID=A0A8J2ML70_9BILA|nr:unnamed protein product [Cercopithifilaria johnstoni]